MTFLEAGSQVVFTSLETHHKDDLVKATIDAGFIVGPGVSKKTSLLVAGDPAVDSSKARKARDYGIPVISELDYVKDYLGGEIKIDIEATPCQAPMSVEDLTPPKREVPKLKSTLAGVRSGVMLHAFLSGEYGPVIVRGPATYSPLGEAWMVGGMPIASKSMTPDKSLRLLGMVDGPELDHETPELFTNHVSHRHYGDFTIYGPVRSVVGTMKAVGPWIIDPSRLPS